MPRFPIQGLRKAQLTARESPSQPGELEAISDEIWDTQTFVNASTTQLTFFQNANNDKTLSNLDAGALLPAPQRFIVHYVTVDYLFPDVTSVAAPAGNLDDLHKLINGTGRGILTFSLAGKPYGPWRLRSTHSAGAPVGFIAGAGAAAPAGSQYGHIGPHDGGFCVNGAIIIPPMTNFAAVIQFGAVQTLNTNNLLIQVGLYGVRYRKVA